MNRGAGCRLPAGHEAIDDGVDEGRGERGEGEGGRESAPEGLPSVASGCFSCLTSLLRRPIILAGEDSPADVLPQRKWDSKSFSDVPGL